jgi:hypothetical protein
MDAATGRQSASVRVEVRTNLDDELRKAWDGLVTTTDLSDVSQLSAWARLRSEAGFSPVYLLAWLGDELVGGAQMLSRRIPILGRIGYVPYGPLLGSENLRTELCATLSETLAECGNRMAALFVQPPAGTEDVAADLLRRGFRPSAAGIAPAASLRIDLSVSEDRLRDGLNRRLRGWTSRWDSRSVSVRPGDENDVALFVEMMSESAAYQNYEPLSANYLLTYFRELAPKGYLKLFVGEIEGEPAAARLYTVCGNVLKARLAGMIRSGGASRLSVPAAVEWNAMLWARSEGLHWFDSGGIQLATANVLLGGGSAGPSEISGPDWFKASFGGTPYLYPQAVERIRSSSVRGIYDLLGRSRRAQDVMQLLRRRVRGGTASARGLARAC